MGGSLLWELSLIERNVLYYILSIIALTDVELTSFKASTCCYVSLASQKNTAPWFLNPGHNWSLEDKN